MGGGPLSFSVQRQAAGEDAGVGRALGSRGCVGGGWGSVLGNLFYSLQGEGAGYLWRVGVHIFTVSLLLRLLTSYQVHCTALHAHDDGSRLVAQPLADSLGCCLETSTSQRRCSSEFR